MTFIKNLEEIKCLCRICTISSDNMISLNSKLNDKSMDGPLITDILEDILNVKVNDNADYPLGICKMCRGNLRIVHDLKIMFNKSQHIFEKYILSLQQFEEMNPFHKNIDLETDGELDMDAEEFENVEDVNIPRKSVKLRIKVNTQNDVKVQWLEGNKFIIEKNETCTSGHKCKDCNKVFSNEEKHSIHLKSCKKNLSCKYCKNIFHSERSLRSHLKARHGTDAPLEIKCDICNESFKNYNARSYHKITRHNTEGKKHTCEICGKAFYFKNSLSQHLECHSRDISRVICPICGKSFHYRGGLFYHMKIHRNERNYICSFCNGRFLNMASLKRHTRIHTGERPYTCSFCAKTFCSVSEVRTHERRHTGQKPHKCKYCKKCFITPYNLKLHISSHTGSQPCDICGKFYLNGEVLKFHMEMKHNVKDQVNEET